MSQSYLIGGVVYVSISLVTIFQIEYLVPTHAALGFVETSLASWTYRLSVMVNGTAVKGSPFLVIVYPSVEVHWVV